MMRKRSATVRLSPIERDAFIVEHRYAVQSEHKREAHKACHSVQIIGTPNLVLAADSLG